MTAASLDKVFDGSIPELYETYLTPLIFTQYAKDIAQRVKVEPGGKILEIAAGTGVVTRALVDVLGAEVAIIATDLNQPMIDYAATVSSDANVTWQQADAQNLPFDDQSFDAVVCQFAVMFFPDRVKAYSEALRVLKPGGQYHFNVWDELKENEFGFTVENSLAELFPDDPPQFLSRTPYAYFDISVIKAELERGGFTCEPNIETKAVKAKAPDPSHPAIAMCQGTPLRNEIESRDASMLMRATDVATAAISKRFGDGAVECKIQAHVISVSA